MWHLAWAESAPVLLASTLFTIAAIEIGVYVVVLAQKIAKESKLKVKRIQDELREEGRAEGRAEVLADLEAARAKAEAKAEEQRAASDEWLARMQEAQQKGETFDEEPPWRANSASES